MQVASIFIGKCSVNTHFIYLFMHFPMHVCFTSNIFCPVLSCVFSPIMCYFKKLVWKRFDEITVIQFFFYIIANEKNIFMQMTTFQWNKFNKTMILRIYSLYDEILNKIQNSRSKWWKWIYFDCFINFVYSQLLSLWPEWLWPNLHRVTTIQVHSIHWHLVQRET